MRDGDIMNEVIDILVQRSKLGIGTIERSVRSMLVNQPWLSIRYNDIPRSY